jgi:hypothetical protein
MRVTLNAKGAGYMIPLTIFNFNQMKKLFVSFFILTIVFACTQKPSDEEFAPLFPFVISYDGLDNASSMAHIIDAPAGNHGFIRVEEGRFANDAGQIRFHATNLTGPANFPTHEVADKLASRLARLGINCVRHHFMDTWYTNFMPEPTQAILADDTNTQRELDPEQLDKLDYLISVFKKHGIYSNLNLHVGRTLDERDGFENADQLPWANKGINHFEPRMIELQKEYAKQLLTHVNKYTGNAYTDEPCVAMVEITNENTLINLYYSGKLEVIPDPYFSELNKQWNNWIKDKYGSVNAIISAWQWTPKDSLSMPDGIKSNNIKKAFINNAVPSVKSKEPFSDYAYQDFVRFLWDVDLRYWTGIHNYLKQDLNVKQPVSGTQLGYSPPDLLAELDYVDIHGYWRHPTGGGGHLLPAPSDKPWYLINDAMVNSMGTIKDRIAISRVHNKPYTISEYGHPYPNQYGAEGQPLMCIYGRLHGWDGVFQYSYNHYVNDFEPQAHPWCLFDCIARTDILAHFPACAAIFIRGDVKEARESVVANVDLKEYQNYLLEKKTVNFNFASLGLDKRLSVIHRTALDFSGTGIAQSNIPKLPDDQKVFISDTEEIVWNTEMPDASYLTVNTDNTKFFTGFPQERTIDLGDNINFTIGKTRLGWATVSMVSRFGTGFGNDGKSANILVAATGDAGNSDRVIKQLGDNKITLSDLGSAPVVVEGIPATITIPADPDKTKCFALDPQGERKKEIPVKKAKDGNAEIKIKPEYETVWYEIEIE